MPHIEFTQNAVDPTKQYVDDLWRANLKLSPNNWRILAGRTIGCIAGRVASPFVEAQSPHLQAAMENGINCWFLPITDFAAQKAFFNALNASSVPREALTLIYEFPLEHGDKLAQELELLPAPDGLTFTHNATLEEDLLLTAFTEAERAIQVGNMRFYGLTHAGLSESAQSPFHVKLGDVIEIAQNAAKTAYGRRKRPHLALLNLPLNVLELGALRHTAQTAKKMDGTEETVSTLELAGRGHLCVFAERPLSVATEGGGLWLTDDDHTAPLRKELMKRLPAEGYWPDAPLENIALKALTSLPSVTGAVVMPGVDYGQTDFLDDRLTPFLQQPDFADITRIIGVR